METRLGMSSLRVVDENVEIFVHLLFSLDCQDDRDSVTGLSTVNLSNWEIRESNQLGD